MKTKRNSKNHPMVVAKDGVYGCSTCKQSWPVTARAPDCIVKKDHPKIVRMNDQYSCSTCGKAWDLGDDTPACEVR